MESIGAVHKLALFYIDKMEVGEEFKQRFWKDIYGYSQNEIIPELIKHDLITEGFDLNSSLNSMKISEIKEILRHNGLKVSGNKGELIERIQGNADLIDLSNLPKFYVLTEKGKDIKSHSRYIQYFHKNVHDIDIFRVNNFYKKYPSLTSDEVIENILMDKVNDNLKKKEYFSASYYSDRLAYFYSEKDYFEKGISQILFSMIYSVLQEYRYEELNGNLRGIDKKHSGIIGYNKDLQIKFKSYLGKHNINRPDAHRMISDVVYSINYDFANADDVSEIILYALEGKDDEINKVFYSRIIEKERSSTNHTNTIKNTGDNMKNSGCLNSGCLTFITLPTITIIYSLTQFIF